MISISDKLQDIGLLFSTSVEVRLGFAGGLVGWLVGEHFLSVTAIMISYIFGMKLQEDKLREVTRLDLPE